MCHIRAWKSRVGQALENQAAWDAVCPKGEKSLDAMLCRGLVERAGRGQIDADLGRPYQATKSREATGAVKSGGFRTLVFFRAQRRGRFFARSGLPRAIWRTLMTRKNPKLGRPRSRSWGLQDAQMDAEVGCGSGMFEVNW